jgi:membrane protein implicated in regulation of membrane protease activity
MHMPHAPHGPMHGHAHAHSHGKQASWLNFSTITAFLAWFGGTGYLLTRYSSIWVLFAFALAILSGLAGAAAVFWFLFKFLLGHESDLDPADYNMVGVLGSVSSSVVPGGTGEMIYSQEGCRRSVGIRSDGNRAIQKGADVVVVRYEKGIAYVKLWDELTNTKYPNHESKEHPG